MPNFSKVSLDRLLTCDARLQRVFNEVIKHWDCTVLEGKRSETQQKLNVVKGVSKTLQSKHVYPIDKPSLAADVAPAPLKWPDRKSATYVKDLATWYAFGGYVMATADQMGIKLRWGADWNGNEVFIDQTFDDLPHFELLD